MATSTQRDQAPTSSRTRAQSGPQPSAATVAVWRRRALIALVPLVGLGIAVATYMAVAHLRLFHGTGSFESLCNFGERFSCDRVNTSDYSEMGGVAIALFAIPAYSGLAFLLYRGVRSDRQEGRRLIALAHVSSWPIVVYSAFLLYVMVFDLGTLCLFCLALDLLNVSVLVVTAWGAGATPRAVFGELGRLSRTELRQAIVPALGIGAVTLTAALLGYDALQRSLEAEARAAVTASSGSASAVIRTPGSTDGDGDSEAPNARKLPTKRWQVPVDTEDPALGPADAKVVIVMFGDFQCGYCKKLEHAARAVREAFSSEVRFVFKHFPMNPRCNPGVQNERHRFACEAAQSAECARRQGNFWRMHELLYKNQHRLDRRDLDYYASEAGLDATVFASCMADPSALDPVRKDAEEGAGLKLNGTPRTFINGRLFSGPLSEDLLTFVIRVELGQVSGKAAERYAPPSESARRDAGAALSP